MQPNGVPEIGELKRLIRELIDSSPDALQTLTTRSTLAKLEAQLGMEKGRMCDPKRREKPDSAWNFGSVCITEVLEDMLDENPQLVEQLDAAGAPDAACAGGPSTTKKPVTSSPGSGRRRRAEGAPKRPLSAFQLFSQQKTAALKKEGVSLDSLPATVKKLWEEVAADERSAMEEEAQGRKRKYEADLAEFKARSTDETPKGKTGSPPRKLQLYNYWLKSLDEESKGSKAELAARWKAVTVEEKAKLRKEMEAANADEKRRSAKRPRLEVPSEPTVKLPEPRTPAITYYIQDKRAKDAALEFLKQEGDAAPGLPQVRAQMRRKWAELADDDPMKVEMLAKEREDEQRYSREMLEVSGSAATEEDDPFGGHGDTDSESSGGTPTRIVLD
eukprot:TRINITY_DN4710_c0_g1_i1.p1 TRINITY_DN4710_c0_g1~~TRINITY_DN4710_c0_g1_i1.p1  ORF type:complete len:388 (+),score=138.74 TRINITY_DN4710_c0_g1_i1:59-1222(+)